MENHYGWTLAKARWLDPVNSPRARPTSSTPGGVREAVQAEVQNRVHGAIGRTATWRQWPWACSLAAVAAILATSASCSGTLRRLTPRFAMLAGTSPRSSRAS